MKKLLFYPILLLAAGTCVLADDALVPANVADRNEKWWAGLTAEQKEEVLRLKTSSAEKTFLRQADPGKIFYDGDVPFAYLPLDVRWKILRERRISFSECREFLRGKSGGFGNGQISPQDKLFVDELKAKRQLLTEAICNALEVCTTPEECRAAAEDVKNFILEIIVGDADWRKRQEAAETAQIIAEIPEGKERERELKKCSNYYSARRRGVAEAEHSMSSALSRIYVKLLFRAFPSDWESVIREFDASMLMRWDTRDRLHFVSETFRKNQDPAFPQENRLTLGIIRELELELRKKSNSQ